MDPYKEGEHDSVEYWKKQAKHYEQKANELQQELDEYTENSAQLEKELEASLIQEEKKNRDLELQLQRQKKEIENLKSKLERSQQETNALESELTSLKIEKEKQAVYVRELEQKNDDLERGQRVISETVSYIEALLNQAYERNAYLENEVDEVEALRVKLQRANDEARDLKQELKVIELLPEAKKEDGTNENTAVVNGHVSSTTRSQVETETQTIISTPQKREINGNAMTPSSRVSAINIVGDLLRKVGLERFLCRECGKVKCSCEAAVDPGSPPAPGPPAPGPLPPGPLPPDLKKAYSESNGIDTNTDSIEYRSKTLSRKSSGSDRTSPEELKPTQRHSEQPFSRFGQGEHGKLRRSFAVRSREGIENLLSFARRGQDQPKTSKIVRQ